MYVAIHQSRQFFFCVARHRSNTPGSIAILKCPPGKDFVTDILHDLGSHTL
jgi:hypothetical protein